GGQGVNLIQLSDGGCVPLYGMAILKDGKLNDCRRMVNAAIDYVVRTPEIGTVFLGGRWMAYASGRELKDPPGHVSDEKLVLPEQAGTDHLDRAEVFTRSLDETLRRLTTAGKRVVFLHAIPELPFDARDCIAWNPNRFVSRTPRPDCQFSREVNEVRNTEFRPLLDAVLAKYADIAVFDPIPLMCDAEVCRGRRDGMLLYRDDDHLSLDGSYWLGRQMRPLLPALLGRGSKPAGLGAAAGGL
ncbi:SGNH hydrolase domain-containing protein, partial [Aromatoleum diolicum]